MAAVACWQFIVVGARWLSNCCMVAAYMLHQPAFAATPDPLAGLLPCSIYAVNKIDQITIEELNVLDKLPHYCPVCAYHEVRVDRRMLCNHGALAAAPTWQPAVRATPCTTGPLCGLGF